MSTVLKEGQKLERVIHVYGIEGPVAVTITIEGIHFRVPGSKKAVHARWADVVRVCGTEESVPSFLFGHAFEFLRFTAEEVQKRKAKRCTIPPRGWKCTREPEHDGPCAAVPIKTRR